MSNVADYKYETYGTARARLKLSSGPIEVFSIVNANEFVTDREITEAEYAEISGCLRQMIDCQLMQSNPRGLVRP